MRRKFRSFSFQKETDEIVKKKLNGIQNFKYLRKKFLCFMHENERELKNSHQTIQQTINHKKIKFSV